MSTNIIDYDEKKNTCQLVFEALQSIFTIFDFSKIYQC